MPPRGVGRVGGGQGRVQRRRLLVAFYGLPVLLKKVQDLAEQRGVSGHARRDAWAAVAHVAAVEVQIRVVGAFAAGVLVERRRRGRQLLPEKEGGAPTLEVRRTARV